MLPEPTPFQVQIGAVILFLSGLSLALSLAGVNRGSPFLVICNRWIRWVLFALGAAFLAQVLGLSSRPFWALATMAFLLWFLLETIYNWVAIHALSRSDLPLFPHFRSNEAGDEWPATGKFIQLRDFLRREGFQKREALQAVLAEEIQIRSSLFDSADRTVRLQVLFVPHRAAAPSAYFIFSSRTEDGGLILTDNVFIPFGGFYPDDWNLLRRPLLRSLPRLLALHKRRLETLGRPLAPWPAEDDPVEALNDQQAILETLNLERGFLVPRFQREERGKITEAGRFRVWQEVWLLNYFGITVPRH